MWFLKAAIQYIMDIVRVPEILLLLVYLYFSLMIGLGASKKIKTFKDFAIGQRNLPTSIIGMTLCATLIGGGSAMGISTEAYKYGIYFVLARYGEVLAFLIVAYIIAPRMDKYFGMISVGDIMAKLYGENYGIVTGISGLLLCIGRVAAQVMALAFVIGYIFGYSQVLAVAVGLGVVVLYSIVGGIRAVILTDVLQFVLMFVMLPFVLNFSINSIGGAEGLIKSIPTYSSNITFDEFIKYITLFLYLKLHLLTPPITQRLLICRDKEQVKQSFVILALGDFIFTTISGIIGIIAYIVSKDLVANTIYLELISEMEGWARAIGIVGIVAIIMSSADSYINAGSICFVNDVLRKFNISDKDKLLYARYSTFFIGLIASFMALSFKSIFDLAMYTSNFWGPVVLGPMLVGIFGYKISSKQCTIAMIAGTITFIIWEYFGLKASTNIHTIFAGMFVNFSITYLSVITFSRGKKYV
jgi:SSS family solute:Na+ symporter